MHTATKTIQIFLANVAAHESRRSARSILNKEVALRICERLRLHLCEIFGPSGYHAVISRAIAVLTKTDGNHWVKQLAINKNGALSLIDLSHAQKRDDTNGEPMDLPAQLLTTLATLIGETLTLNLAKEVWPMVEQQEARDKPIAP